MHELKCHSDAADFSHRLLSESAAPGLQCGDCTACCTVLAVTELQKPARRACDHVCCSGCRIYENRPQECRQFHCLWMRGALGADPALRPDTLGVMFDCFIERGSRRLRFVAFELWPGAMATTAVRDLLDRFAAIHVLELSYRDGIWTTLEREPGAGENAL